jgi:hypothetical protein
VKVLYGTVDSELVDLNALRNNIRLRVDGLCEKMTSMRDEDLNGGRFGGENIERKMVGVEAI